MPDGLIQPGAFALYMSRLYNLVALVLAKRFLFAVKRETRSWFSPANVCCPRNGKQVSSDGLPLYATVRLRMGRRGGFSVWFACGKLVARIPARHRRSA